MRRTSMDAHLPEHIARQGQETAELYVGAPPEPTEDQFTKTVERYTASIPSSGFLAIALGSMGLSLLFQLGGRGKWGNFVAQWVPTWLLFGIYNKLVKLEGHDRHDGGESSVPATRRGTGISNRPSLRNGNHRMRCRLAVRPPARAGSDPGRP
jgi:hypothetical protein